MFKTPFYSEPAFMDLIFWNNATCYKSFDFRQVKRYLISSIKRCIRVALLVANDLRILENIREI